MVSDIVLYPEHTQGGYEEIARGTNRIGGFHFRAQEGPAEGNRNSQNRRRTRLDDNRQRRRIFIHKENKRRINCIQNTTYRCEIIITIILCYVHSAHML